MVLSKCGIQLIEWPGWSDGLKQKKSARRKLPWPQLRGMGLAKRICRSVAQGCWKQTRREKLIVMNLFARLSKEFISFQVNDPNWLVCPNLTLWAGSPGGTNLSHLDVIKACWPVYPPMATSGNAEWLLSTSNEISESLPLCVDLLRLVLKYARSGQRHQQTAPPQSMSNSESGKSKSPPQLCNGNTKINTDPATSTSILWVWFSAIYSLHCTPLALQDLLPEPRHANNGWLMYLASDIGTNAWCVDVRCLCG